MWLTGINGKLLAQAKALAAAIPTRIAPTKPGPYVTATASKSLTSMPAVSKASLKQVVITSTW